MGFVGGYGLESYSILSQSTNDVYPTAVKIALHASIARLQEAMGALAGAFLSKGEEFSPFIKMGRIQLQDAVPMTLGQEFTAEKSGDYASFPPPEIVTFVGLCSKEIRGKTE